MLPRQRHKRLVVHREQNNGRSHLRTLNTRTNARLLAIYHAHALFERPTDNEQNFDVSDDALVGAKKPRSRPSPFSAFIVAAHR